MSVKILLRIMFAIWAMAVAGLSVISYPGSKDLLMSVKLTSSGFVVHGIAYFVGMLLCYWAFEKKEDGDQRSEIRSRMPEDGKKIEDQMSKRQRSEIRSQISEVGRTDDGGHRSKVTFIWMSGVLIFLFSVVLEVVQFHLPYRTFNVYDIVGNGIGILLFGVLMFFISHAEAQRSEVRRQMADDTPVKSAAL